MGIKFAHRGACLHEQPIIALCTPQGSGAIALIRISGDGAIELIDRISKLSNKGCHLPRKKLADLPSHTIHHGHIISTDETVIDEVLFLLMKAPKTFTGQDTVEISCHNNTFIINAIIEQAIAHGAHHAQRGEFSRRAFLNKKIDLIQAEAIHDLIGAQNEIALKKSMAQLKGTLSHSIKDIEDELLATLGLVEASFEFLDEEQRDIKINEHISKKVKKLIEKTNDILQNFSQQKQIREGIRISLVGNTNVGKSTLFNRLAKQKKAIVTDIHGTTRDAIEATLHKNGVFWSLVDTAGLRKTEDQIEAEGINRTWQEAEQSDIILLVLDATKKTKVFPSMSESISQLAKKHLQKCITIINKADLLENEECQALSKNSAFEKSIFISAKNGDGITELEEIVQKKIDQMYNSSQTRYLLNQRQYNLISEINKKLHNIKVSPSVIEHEIVAHHLKEIIEIISEITGKTINEKMMDRVFDSFCIGK